MCSFGQLSWFKFLILFSGISGKLINMLSQSRIIISYSMTLTVRNMKFWPCPSQINIFSCTPSSFSLFRGGIGSFSSTTVLERLTITDSYNI